MARVTLQVLEGLERGVTFDELSTPLTIGREDDNAIRLNDERVSRFHAKIQEDDDRVIITDLESTNGTRVNGHPIQIHVLRPGDLVSVGRCLLLYGTDAQIKEAAKKSKLGLSSSATAGRSDPTMRAKSPPFVGGADDESTANTYRAKPGLGDADIFVEGGFEPSLADSDLPEMFPGQPPVIPSKLTAAQRAEMSDLLAFLHDRLRQVLESRNSGVSGQEDEIRVPFASWQALIALQAQLSKYLRTAADPSNENR